MSSAVITKFETYLLTEKCVAANTFAAYKKDIEQFMQYLAEQKIVLDKVTTQDIKKFLKHLKDLSIGPRSVARKISALKLLFKYLHDRFDWEDKAHELSIPKFKKALPSYLSEKEIEALLQVADHDTSDLGKRNKIMLYLLYVSGMRISELVGIKQDALHFDTGFIMVQGKGGKQRMVPIPLPMMDLMRVYIQEIHAAFAHKHPTDYLFPVFYGGKVKPISRQSFWLILNELWRKTGIKKTISPHQLRHSLATHMLKNGANIRALQLMLGHENIATVQIYTHVETTHVRKVYDEKHPRSE